jgi:hypothetical protein
MIWMTLLRKLIDIVLASSDPDAALRRAIVAAETEALNVAADEALKRL